MQPRATTPADTPDYYELLQISASAETETIQRVYRMLAQRYHPDNQQTGDPKRFRELVEACDVLSEPARRAQYDLLYNEQRKTRYHAVSVPDRADNPIEVEQMVRLTVLEVLYERRRTEPGKGGVFVLDLESLTGQAREHLELTNSPARQLAASPVLLQSTACLSLLLYWTCPCPPRCRAGTSEYLTPTLIRSAGSPSA